MACSTLPGNALEGKHFIINKEQILEHHQHSGKIHLADSKYDEHENYRFSRSHDAIPIIEYNPRNEKTTAPALRERGYDQNGWPYAPCGILTRPNGFDYTCQRASFSCRRQCVSSKDPKIVQYSEDCPYWVNYHGYTKHMSIKEFPRLITEVIRGTYRYQKIKALRSASERTNSTAKEDFSILAKPKVRGIHAASVLAQISVIVVLLKRITKFIIRVTLAFRNTSGQNKSPPPNSTARRVPDFLRNLIQKE